MQDRIKAIEKAREITSQSGDLDIWILRGHAPISYAAQS